MVEFQNTMLVPRCIDWAGVAIHFVRQFLWSFCRFVRLLAPSFLVRRRCNEIRHSNSFQPIRWSTPLLLKLQLLCFDEGERIILLFTFVCSTEIGRSKWKIQDKRASCSFNCCFWSYRFVGNWDTTTINMWSVLELTIAGILSAHLPESAHQCRISSGFLAFGGRFWTSVGAHGCSQRPRSVESYRKW